MPLRQLFKSPGLTTPASLSCLRGYYSNMALGTVKGSITLFKEGSAITYYSFLTYGPQTNHDFVMIAYFDSVAVLGNNSALKRLLMVMMF